MAEQVINKINMYETFAFDKEKNRVINLKSNEDVNIDEFLDIQYLLDKNKIQHKFESNFEIQIIK